MSNIQVYPPLTNELAELFVTTTTGGITFIGNTLGLSKKTNSQDAGTDNAIGAFISTNPLLKVPTYPTSYGTTLNSALNSSSAILKIPFNSKILHAELFWGGTYEVNNVSHSSSALNIPVQLTLPNSKTIAIDLDTYVLVLKNPSVGFYTCQSDITSYLQDNPNGTYTVSNVLGTIDATDNSDNCCGWTLGIVYKNETLPYRYLNLSGGLALINEHYINNQILNNFEALSKGPTKARIAISAIGGNAPIQGDQVLFGSDLNKSLKPLSGPKNGSNNFFASQINNDLGETDTSGTFGNSNQIINVSNNSGENIVGGRQGYDITNVDGTNILQNSATTGILQFKTSSDVYVPNALGVQIDINAPNFTDMNIVVNSFIASIGLTTSYVITFTNTGSTSAENVILSDVLPYGLEYTPKTLYINNTINKKISNLSNIPLGTINVGESFTISFEVVVTQYPINPAVNGMFINFATLNYDFNSSNKKIQGKSKSNISYLNTPASLKKAKINIESNKDFVGIGDTINYTINIVNSLPYPTIDTKFKLVNKLPQGLEYVPNTLTLNNSKISNSINDEFFIPSLEPDVPMTIKFNAKVVSNPTNGFEYSIQATLYYNMNVPKTKWYEGASITVYYDYSNVCTILNKNFVIHPNISITSNKTNLAVVPKEDTIEYTITVSNLHDITISGITLIDILPYGLSYKANTLTIDGKPLSKKPNHIKDNIPYIPIKTGVSLGNIEKNKSVTVKFIADVISSPKKGLAYPNFATINYHLNSPVGVLPNTMNTKIINSYEGLILKGSLSSNKAFITSKKNSLVEYTIDILNPTNYTIKNITLTDILPAGLEYKTNSLNINNKSLSNFSSLKDGIPIGALKSKESTTVNFSALEISKPSKDNIYSNFATINYNFNVNNTEIPYKIQTNISKIFFKNDINVSLKSNKTNLTVVPKKDTIEYTIIISNPHDMAISKATLLDILPYGLSYRPNTLTINGTPPSKNPTISTNNIKNTEIKAEISLENIKKNESLTVKFIADVTSNPKKGLIYSNFATINYTVNSPIGSFHSTINTNTINSYKALILEAIITANTTFVTPKKNSLIKYNIKITNPNNYNIIYIHLTDIIPTGLKYKTKSLTILGKTPSNSFSLKEGIPIGTLKPKESTNINFTAIELSKPSKENVYSNFATITYNFIVNDLIIPYKIQTNVNKILFRNDIIPKLPKITLNPLSLKNYVYTTYKNTPTKNKLSAINLTNFSLNPTIYSYPSNGYAKINLDNSWTYDPKVNFIGTDKFTILLKDSDIGSLLVNIIIIVKNL